MIPLAGLVGALALLKWHMLPFFFCKETLLGVRLDMESFASSGAVPLVSRGVSAPSFLYGRSHSASRRAAHRFKPLSPVRT